MRRNVGENVEPEVPQVLVNPFDEKVCHDELRATFQVLAQVMMTPANREVVASMNPIVGMAETSVRDFTRMNSSEFYGSKVEEDP